MLKTLGLILCAGAPPAAGIWHAAGLIHRERLVRGLSAFAAALEEGVCVYARDQKAIYADFSERYLDRTGFTDLLRKECEERPWGALYRTLARYFAREDPGEAVRKRLLSFAENFGALAMPEQAESCRALTNGMKEASDREKSNLQNGIRLSLTTGLAVGFGFLILFW